MNSLDFSTLVGKTFNKIETANLDWDFKPTELWFENETEAYKLYHQQDCCESVYLADVTGELEDLINSPILMAYVASNQEDVTKEIRKESKDFDSETWTFYHLATIKGYVTLRWIGTSNGYYSEDVDFVKVK